MDSLPSGAQRTRTPTSSAQPGSHSNASSRQSPCTSGSGRSPPARRRSVYRRRWRRSTCSSAGGSIRRPPPEERDSTRGSDRIPAQPARALRLPGARFAHPAPHQAPAAAVQHALGGVQLPAGPVHVPVSLGTEGLVAPLPQVVPGAGLVAHEQQHVGVAQRKEVRHGAVVARAGPLPPRPVEVVHEFPVQGVARAEQAGGIAAPRTAEPAQRIPHFTLPPHAGIAGPVPAVIRVARPRLRNHDPRVLRPALQAVVAAGGEAAPAGPAAVDHRRHPAVVDHVAAEAALGVHPRQRRLQRDRVVLPVDQVAAGGVSPADPHVLVAAVAALDDLVRGVRVVLVEQVVAAAPVERPVGIVEPSSRRQEVEARPVGVALEPLLQLPGAAQRQLRVVDQVLAHVV